jgi:hypothetical protein
MPDTVPIARADLQQLLELVGIIEEATEYIDGHMETNMYECLEYCCQIRKALNKMRGLFSDTSIGPWPYMRFAGRGAT